MAFHPKEVEFNGELLDPPQQSVAVHSQQTLPFAEFYVHLHHIDRLLNVTSASRRHGGGKRL